jgi:hypothetical protein
MTTEKRRLKLTKVRTKMTKANAVQAMPSFLTPFHARLVVLFAASAITDETISPVISILPDIEPIQLRSEMSGDAGTTSAIASPRRVTRSGVFVLLTWSSN